MLIKSEKCVAAIIACTLAVSTWLPLITVPAPAAQQELAPPSLA